jgi:hypothetical protein
VPNHRNLTRDYTLVFIAASPAIPLAIATSDWTRSSPRNPSAALVTRPARNASGTSKCRGFVIPIPQGTPTALMVAASPRRHAE